MAPTTSTNQNPNHNSKHDQPVIRRRQVPSRRRRDGLIQYAGDHTSQNGEDGIIARIFDCLPPPSTGAKRYCVDVGAWDGKHLSNTHSLLVSGDDSKTTVSSWKGLLIEADPDKVIDLQALHQPLGNICVHKVVSVQPNSPNNLPSILKDYAPPNFPLDFDFLCVDIDGGDYWVLHELLVASSYRPKVICIEFNPTMPNDLVYIPPQSDVIRQGASLAALVELAEQWDYVLVETTLFNAFLVPQSIYQAHLQNEVPNGDRSIEALHEVSMGTSLYQLYDGTLKLWGCKKLLWHGIGLHEEKLQMLPPEKRHFPFAPSSSSTLYEEDDFDLDSAVDMSPICKTPRSSNMAMATVTTSATDETEQALCADALLQQLQLNGFAFIRGTGISRDLCQKALHYTKAFLTDADEDVRRACLTKDRARRGYSPICTENFASLVGEHGPNDLVRKFRIGPTSNASTSISDHDENDATATSPSSTAGCSSLLQPNVWPTADTWDESPALSFQTTLEEYYREACRAANSVVAAICNALQRQQPQLELSVSVLSSLVAGEENSSSSSTLESTSILTLLGYTVGTRHKKKGKKHISPLVASHTDVGVITMLLFDSLGCAQLQRSDKEKTDGWTNVSLPLKVPDDPIFVVNIGDCLSELTRGSLPSTLHRVVADYQHKDPRHCLALFVGLDPQAQLTLPACSNKNSGGGDSHETEEEPRVMSYEEWRKRRIARSQQVLKSKAASS